MASINEILGKNIDSVKALKAEIKSLQDSLVGLDAETQEFKDTSYKLAAAQDELTKVTKAGRDENIAATDSIVGMQKEYKKLYDQYKLLSEEQRNSDFGKNMAESLEALSTKLNDTKKGVGNFKDNIGRYAGDITDAFSKMGLSVGALQGPLNIAKNGFTALNATMKANPVGIIITAITALIALFKKMKDAVSQNEELQMRWNEAMAKFQPIIDAVKNGLDRLAGAFTSYIEWISKCVEKIREFGAAVTDFLGITKGAKKELQETQKIYDDIAKSTSNLAKQKREYQKLDADDKARVEALREEASETTNLEEKQRLLTEAKEIQAQIDQRAIEVAEEELRILEEQASLTANDAAANDKLAAATARVSQAQATAAANARMFNKQLSATTKTTTTATSSMKNYREEAKKLYEEIIENSKDEITKLTEKYEKEKKLLEKYHYDTKLLTVQYNREVDKIRQDAALKGLRQRREDLKQEWELYRNSGREDVALALEGEVIEKKTIPAVKKLKTEVESFLNTFVDESKLPDLDAYTAKMKEMEDLINDKGFDALPDEFKDIKDSVDETNAAFGLSISTVSNLETTLEELELRLSQINKEYKEIKESKAGEEQFRKIDEMVRNMSIDMFNEAFSFDIDYSGYKEMTNYILESEYLILAEQKKAYAEELANFSGNTDQKLQMLQAYYAVVDELEARHQALTDLNGQRTMEMVDNLIDATDSLAGALGTIKSSYDTLVESELRAGKIDEKQAQEKKKRLLALEKWQTAFSIATIAADAAAGLFNIWKGYAMERGTINPQTAAAAGPGAAAALGVLNTKSLVSAIAKSASLAATATAQIMAARNGVVSSINNFSAESAGSSGSGDVGASPILIDSTPYSYTRTLQTEEDVDNINNQPIWVSVTDIESGLGHRAQVVGESSF